jgi:hypothetical protein
MAIDGNNRWILSVNQTRGCSMSWWHPAVVQLLACERVLEEWANQYSEIARTFQNDRGFGVNAGIASAEHRREVPRDPNSIPGPEPVFNEQVAADSHRIMLQRLYDFNTLIAGVNSVLHASPDGMACGTDPAQLLSQ